MDQIFIIMNKKYFIYAASALAFTACSNDDFVGNNGGNEPGTGDAAILFNGSAGKITRADENAKQGEDAAQKLNNRFWVYGTKTTGSDDNTSQQVVYNNYLVKYLQHAGHTTTNTNGWEYVGLNNNNDDNNNYTTGLGLIDSVAQTIKYWDHSATNYQFSAFSAKPEDLSNGSKLKVERLSDSKNGYTVTLKDGVNLDDLYFADAKTVVSANYRQTVTFTFRHAYTKVRFGVYETIPGYTVKITSMKAEVSNKPLTTSTNGEEYTINFEDENTTPKLVSTKEAQTEINLKDENTFTEPLSTTADKATYNNENEKYDYYLPTTSNDEMTLTVDYELTSEDNSGEKINVTGATAKVPKNLLDWQPNCAYTYLFKISDNTNGSTGGSDKPGLYPISFDASVVEIENGIQQTITTVADPSITTYAKGSVDNNNEYTAGSNIYVAVAGKNDLSVTGNINCRLYTVTVEGNITVTEETVANILTEPNNGTHNDDSNNKIEVKSEGAPSLTIVENIDKKDTSDGKEISGKFAKISNATAGTYAFEYTYTDTSTQDAEGTTTTKKKAYKIIKVKAKDSSDSND